MDPCDIESRVRNSSFLDGLNERLWRYKNERFESFMDVVRLFLQEAGLEKPGSQPDDRVDAIRWTVAIAREPIQNMFFSRRRVDSFLITPP